MVIGAKGLGQWSLEESEGSWSSVESKGRGHWRSSSMEWMEVSLCASPRTPPSRGVGQTGPLAHLSVRLIFSPSNVHTSSNVSEANAVRLYFAAGGATGRWASGAAHLTTLSPSVPPRVSPASSGSHEGDASWRGEECARSSASTPLSALYPHSRDEDRRAVDVEGETPVQLSDPAGKAVGDLDPASGGLPADLGPASDPSLLGGLLDGMPVSVRTAILGLGERQAIGKQLTMLSVRCRARLLSLWS